MLKTRMGMSDRPEQERLTAKVDELLDSQDAATLFAEAPTGTGKTISYLVPALTALADKRISQVVISTGTNALSDQIVKKDLPESIRGMGLRNIKVVQLKGFQSYVCSEKAKDELLLGAVALYEGDDKKAAHLKNFMEQRGGTMLVELEDLGMGYSKSSKQVMCCDGEKKCAYEEAACRFKLHMSEIPTAAVIVTNHYYLSTRSGYLSHMKDTDGAAVMYVFDEAHRLPEIIDHMQAGKFNLSILGKSSATLLDLAEREETPDWLSGYDYLNETMRRHLKLLDAGVSDLSRRIEAKKTELVDTVEILRSSDRDHAVDQGLLEGRDTRLTGEPINNREILSAVLSSFYSLRQPMERVIERARKEIGRLKNKARESGAKSLTMDEAKDLEMLTSMETAASHLNRIQKRYSRERLLALDKNPDNGIAKVFWMDRGSENLYFRYGSAVGPKAERGYYADALSGVFGPRSSKVMLISATLSANAIQEHLEPMARKFRLFGRKELKFFSNKSFDFASNVRLSAVTSPVFAQVDFKKPHTLISYHNELIDHFSKVLPKVDGGSLVLFTNQSNMHYVADGLKEQLKRTGIEILKQGDEPTHRLIDRMRRGPNEGKTYVLCGVETLWEGVDLRGKALRGLFIVKFPFGNPDDPVESKRRDLYKHAKVDYFRTKGLPETLMTLRQGFGRLVRDESDFGVVEILDHRFSIEAQPKYLTNVRNAFPIPIEITSISDAPARIEEFFMARGGCGISKVKNESAAKSVPAKAVPTAIPEETFETEYEESISLSL
jgi:ATP-dependent DNA helicase DinG